MKAFVNRVYGSSEVIKLEQVPIPVPQDKQVLIRTRAVALNHSDWEFLKGEPAYIRGFGLFKPYRNILGTGTSLSRYASVTPLGFQTDSNIMLWAICKMLLV
jgi:NADPH:quinone reductase-like Zn-dependent oxidoreductase